MTQEQLVQGMQAALAAAKRGLSRGELPIGAVLMGPQGLVASAYNRVSGKGLLWHAELSVLAKCDNREFLRNNGIKRKELTLFTTLEPCVQCYGAAMNFHLGGIAYGLESPDDGVQNLVELWEREKGARGYFKPVPVVARILRTECQGLFAEFAVKYPASPFVGWAQQLAQLPLLA